MPSPLEGLFDPPPESAAAKPSDGGNASPLSAAMGAIQRHGGLFGVLHQLEKAGAGDVAQALLSGGLGKLDAAPGANTQADEKLKS